MEKTPVPFQVEVVGIAGGGDGRQDPKPQVQCRCFIFLQPEQVGCDHGYNVESALNGPIERHSSPHFALVHLADILKYSQSVDKDANEGFIDDSLFIDDRGIDEIVIETEH